MFIFGDFLIIFIFWFLGVKVQHPSYGYLFERFTASSLVI
ncbi:unnamed protein product, partial [Vitis vinifera]